MATEKVLTLGTEGIEEKEITTGGGGQLKGTNWVNWCYNSMAPNSEFRLNKKDYGSGVCFFFPNRDSETTGVLAKWSDAGFSFTSGSAGAGVTLPNARGVGGGVLITTGTALTGLFTPTMNFTPGLPDKDFSSTKHQVTDLEDSLVEIKIRLPPALSNGTQRYIVNTYMYHTAGSGEYVGLNYTDNVNSGKWQLTYVNEANATITVDTGIAAVGNTAYTARFRAVWNSSTSKFEVTVSIGAFSTVLTNVRMNAVLSSVAEVRGQLTFRKTVGTTATLLRLTDACVIVGLK